MRLFEQFSNTIQFFQGYLEINQINLLENIWMAEFVHQLNLLEHIISIGPVLVQFQDHNFVTRFMCDLQNKRRNSFKTSFSQLEFRNRLQSSDATKDLFTHLDSDFC